MSYNPKDHFFKKAKSEDFLARSVYKLQEIDDRLKIIKPGHHILDLGASPGSWSQYCIKKVGPKGKVVGIDLTFVGLKHDNYFFQQEDIHNVNWEALKGQACVDRWNGVLSDMAPKTTGIRNTDQMRSLELCQMALNVAVEQLKPKGYFVCKLFHSESFKEFQSELKKHFERCDAIKPDSTRKISKEIFIIGLGFKGK